MAGGRTSLYERQWNEVDAIKSIYIDEYEGIEFPWKVRGRSALASNSTKVDHPPSFRIHLSHAVRSLIDTNDVAAVIEFKLTTSYPETAPIIKVSRKKNIQAYQAAKIQEALIEKSQSLIGSEMIFELVEIAKELLADACGKTFSFYDEMTLRKNSNDLAAAKSAGVVALQPSQEVCELANKIKEELGRKAKVITSAREGKRLTDATQNSTAKVVTFDPPITLELPDSDKMLTISKVKMGDTLIDAQFGNCYSGSTEEGLDLLMIQVRFEGAASFYHTIHGRKKLALVGKKIQEFEKVRYSSLYCRLLGATFMQVGEEAIDLWIASENHDGTVLEKLLKCSGCFSLKNSMIYIESILHALSHLHACSIAHQDLSISNIVISTSTSRVKLINPVLTRLLRDLHQTHPISKTFFLPDEVSWRPPEVLSKSGQAGKKADIWHTGHILLQMLHGPNFTLKFEEPEEALEFTKRLPDQVRDFLSQAMQRNPEERPSAVEMLHHEAFSQKSMQEYEKYNVFNTTELPSPGTKKSARPVDTLPRPEMKKMSRYRTDFEEMQFLGRGAFGEVIKVRNRIDNRFYAIKRIRLDPLNVEYNKKILREVTMLSRLHHERIVRYYQAWIEGGLIPSENEQEGSDGDGDDSGSDGTSDRNQSWSQTRIKNKQSYLESTQTGSTTSLSSMLRFHTGFTSDEDLEETTKDIVNNNASASVDAASTGLSGSTDDAKAVQSQYLYIQMEYCPNQTLRSAMDTEVDHSECWRLFRQIIEGLSHVHSQGMIHRDLKPGNIFLDTNGDVKIGDFGLAVGQEGGEKTAGNSGSRDKRPDETTESLTGGIGTPLYVSPEQESTTNRYNEKVDMYSLGIIFLELWVPFGTEMERALVIKEARSPNVNLPALFKKPEMSKQASILQNLLSHDPKTRFTSDELLKSDLLPPKVEDEYINEAIRSVSTPGTPYFNKLIATLFAQRGEELKDYTFDYHSGFPSDLATFSGLNAVSCDLISVFKRHGAIELTPPLLIPRGAASVEQLHAPQYLMPSTGQIVQLPNNLTRPFARFIAHTGITDVKRYSISRTYRGNIAGGQPRQPADCSFDIVYSSGDGLVRELEVIRVACESVREVAGQAPLSFVLRVNHLEILFAILTQCFVPSIKRKIICDLLAQYQNTSWLRMRSLLAAQVVLPPSCIDALGKMAGMKDLDSGIALKRLDELLQSVKECAGALSHLRQLVTCLQHLGVKIKACVDPLFVNGDELFSGIMIQISLEDRKRGDALASGGSYKKLIDGYRYPTDMSRHVSSIGIVLQLSKLLLVKKTFAARALRNVEVMVYATSPGMFQEKIAVASMLWDSQIEVEIISEDVVSSDYVVQVARARGLAIAIQLKDPSSRGPFGMVKIRNFERRQEVEVPRDDLVETLRAIFADLERESSGQARHETETTAGAQPLVTPFNVTLFAPSVKFKGTQKSMIMDKAVRAMTMFLSSVAGPKVSEVVVHDLPRELVRRAVDALMEGDETFKRKFDSRDDRETATKLRDLLFRLRDKKAFAFLYSYREECIDVVPLIESGL